MNAKIILAGTLSLALVSSASLAQQSLRERSSRSTGSMGPSPFGRRKTGPPGRIPPALLKNSRRKPGCRWMHCMPVIGSLIPSRKPLAPKRLRSWTNNKHSDVAAHRTAQPPLRAAVFVHPPVQVQARGNNARLLWTAAQSVRDRTDAAATLGLGSVP